MTCLLMACFLANPKLTPILKIHMGCLLMVFPLKISPLMVNLLMVNLLIVSLLMVNLLMLSRIMVSLHLACQLCKNLYCLLNLKMS